MYYIANWGTQQLTFRFPKSLISQNAIAPYCVAYCISLSGSGEWAILDWEFDDEEGFDWIEEGSSLSELVGLRQEILPKILDLKPPRERGLYAKLVSCGQGI